ncbi:MAG: YfjI family protein [Mangrovicoccus sp.]|nr:YfjI family protein [Mangrovicoccus sp.]
MNAPFDMPEPTPFEAGEDWPEPDMSLAAPERAPARALSDEQWRFGFGDWADWLADAAASKSAPVDYVALSLLAVAGACIGNTRWASPNPGWKETPVIWAMLVGDPSASKSPGLKP